MRLCVLGSGSRGHAVYVEAGETRVLFDAGFTGLELKRRLSSVGVDAAGLSAIVISHEHSDHVAGLRALAKRLPVYATEGTFSWISNRFTFNGTEVIRPGEWYAIGPLRFLPVSVSHDAEEPVGFVIQDGDCRAAVVTDLGVVTKSVQHLLHDLDLAVIESNHDPRMLIEGPYPWDLKQRIKGRLGHLSNPQAAELIASISHPGLRHVMVAHLSETNNTPALASASAHDAVPESCRVHACCQARPAPMIKL
ncbi:MAG TPA: MBL fold metallo-hydrolase [bacterium]|nr:MBL fold metallo-hydrolase [bacterium]